MEKPKIILYGKTYTPSEPKMKVWRKFLASYDEDKTQLTVEEFLDEQVELILLAFDREEVTREAVDENLGVADIVPLVRGLFLWIQSQAFAHLEKIPNARGEEG